MTRLVPWLGAALFVPFGLWVLRDPSDLAALTERPLPTATALTDSRTVDGGLVVGLGVLFAACALDPTRTRTGLLAMALSIGGAFVGRCVGMATDGVTGATLRVALRELGITTLAASALVRESHQLGGRQP